MVNLKKTYTKVIASALFLILLALSLYYDNLTKYAYFGMRESDMVLQALSLFLKPIMWAIGEWVVLSLFFGSAVGRLPRCTKIIAVSMLFLLCGLYLAAVIIRFSVSEFAPLWDVVRLLTKYPSVYALAGLSVFILEHIKEREN